MPLLTSLLLLIVFSRLLGALAERFEQPAIVGEMLAGVLLGPAVLGLIHANPALSGISQLAVFLVVLSAGLEMNFKDVLEAMQGGGLRVALLSFFIPLFAGMGVGMLFHLDVMRTVFLGLSIAITALPVAVRILESFKLLDSRIARYAISAAILNDLAALLILGVILNLPDQKTFGAIAYSVAITGGKLLLLGMAILGFYRMLEKAQKAGVPLSRVPEKLIQLFGNEALFGILVAFVLVFASISELLGFHFVIGAFFGALMIDRTFFLASRYRDLEKTIGSVTNGFLAPLFFAYLGLEFDPRVMRTPGFLVAVLIVSVAAKIFAGTIAGPIVNMERLEALGLGIILNGRGVVGLVVASIAYDRKFIDKSLFSTLVLMSIVTTILAPILFRKCVLPRLNGSGSLDSRSLITRS